MRANIEATDTIIARIERRGPKVLRLSRCINGAWVCHIERLDLWGCPSAIPFHGFGESSQQAAAVALWRLHRHNSYARPSWFPAFSLREFCAKWVASQSV